MLTIKNNTALWVWTAQHCCLLLLHIRLIQSITALLGSHVRCSTVALKCSQQKRGPETPSVKGRIWVRRLQIFCIFVLLLVFQVLSSTAEDFFSPILTQISQDMGLPPRFAGGELEHSCSDSFLAALLGQYSHTIKLFAQKEMYVSLLNGTTCSSRV